MKLSEKWKGDKNPRWNGGRRVLTTGHIMIKAIDHPNVSKDGYVLEHRLVMEKHLNRYLTKKEVVHHKNGDASDNSIDNLILESSHSEHMRKFHNNNKSFRRKNVFTSCIQCGRSNVKADTIKLCHNCYQSNWNKKRRIVLS